MKMTKKYIAKLGAPFGNKDAQEIGEFVFNKCQGLTTKEILTLVKDYPEHKIYSLLEWDDSKASENYRLWQVRNIVNHLDVEIISVGESKPVKMFFNIKNKNPAEENTWHATPEVFNNKYMKEQVIETAKKELAYWTNKYESYKELFEIIKPIKKFLKK